MRGKIMIKGYNARGKDYKHEWNLILRKRIKI